VSDEAYDFVIVGAGSAGCVLAARLSANGSVRTLLIEAGGSDRQFSIKVPIGYGKAFHDPGVNWCYHTAPDPGLGGRTSYWPRGKVLGGSSSINAMVYCRGLPGDYDDWRDAGNPGWGWSDVEPVFCSFERRVAADGSSAGQGPLWVCDREIDYHPVRRYFYDAAREIGLSLISDLNGANPEGVGPYAINTRKGLRWSAADAFLRPAMRRPNLEVRTGTLVERVFFEGRRAIGVICRGRAGVRRVTARREVIVCAGAINSPKLLQLSGIGPGELLAQFSIAVRHANPAVGASLQDHLGINYFYRATRSTLNADLGTWPGRARSALRFLLARSGPLSLSVNQIGGLVRSSPDRLRPDIQLYMNPLSYSVAYANKRPLLRPDPHPGFVLGFNAWRPTSHGRIVIAAPDPGVPPRIEPGYLSTEQDLKEALAGSYLVARLQQTRALRTLIAGEPPFDVTRASDQQIIADLRARGGSVFHACGTCRMAPETEGGVVGPDLKVHGVEGLRVADASVFPNITSANTHAPTLLVAHMAARAMGF
jgi:choline dehydrogenase